MERKYWVYSSYAYADYDSLIKGGVGLDTINLANQISSFAEHGLNIRDLLHEKGFFAGKPFYDYWYKFCENEEEKKELELFWESLCKEKNGNYIDDKGNPFRVDGRDCVYTILRDWRNEVSQGLRSNEIIMAAHREHKAKMEFAKELIEKNQDRIEFTRERSCRIRDIFLSEVWGDNEPRKELIEIDKFNTPQQRHDFLEKYFLLATDWFVEKFHSRGFVFDENASTKNNIYAVRKVLSDTKTVFMCMLDIRGISLVRGGDDISWSGSSSISVDTYVSQQKNASTVVLSEKNIRSKFRKIHHPILDYVGYSHYFSAPDLERCLNFWSTLAEVEEPYIEKVLGIIRVEKGVGVNAPKGGRS